MSQTPSAAPAAAAPTVSAAIPALSVRGLRKTYDNRVQALKGVSLDVAQGDFFALLGPNGAGKSTLIGIVSSLVNLTEGSVSIFGTDLVRERDAAMRLIGLVPQELNFNMFEKPLDILVNYAGFYGVPRAQAIERAEVELRRAQLWDKAQMMSRTLSGGMKRRLMIARAMMTRPRLLILDEPTAGVDIEIRRGMWQTLREINAAGTTIILTTHYIEEAEDMADRIGVIRKGELIVVEEKATLMRQLGQKQLALTLQQPLATVPETLAQWPLTLSADGLTLTYSFDAQKDDTGIAELLAALGTEGIHFKDLRSSESSLEDIFVSLVHENKEVTA